MGISGKKLAKKFDQSTKKARPLAKIGNFEVDKVIQETAANAVDQTQKGQITDLGLGKNISTAFKSLGNDASKAYDTSIKRPVGKAANDAKEAAKKLGGKAEDWLNKMNSTSGGGSNIPQVGVGIGMPGGAGGAPSGPVQIQALNGQGGSAGAGNNEFRTGQMTLAQQLAQQAAGQGPSLATETLKQGQAANQAAIFAQLASQRGGANPGLARQAMQTSAQIQGQTARDAALARIQEQMGAREQLAGVLGTGRTGDIQTAGQQNELAVAQAQLAQQHAELQAKYTAMGLDAQKANQLASIEMEKMDRGLMSPAQQALQTGAGILTSIFA